MGLQLLLELSCLPGSKGYLHVANNPHCADRQYQARLGQSR